MDNRRQLAIALVASTAVLVVWLVISQRFFPAAPVTTRPTTAPTTAPATAPSAKAETPKPLPRSGSQPALASSPSTAGLLTAEGAAAPQTAQLGSDAATSLFPMKIEFTSLGAAVADVDLRDFKRTVGKDEPYPLLTPVADPITGHQYYSFATEKIRIETFHEDIPLADLPWTIDRAASTDEKLAFRVTIERQGKPLMEVTKTYTLPKVGPKPKKGKETLASRRSDLLLDYSLRNLTSEPLDAILVQFGPIGMHQEDPRSDDRGVVAAIEEGGKFKIDKKHVRKAVTPERDPQGRLVPKNVELGKDQGPTLVGWAAEINKFFGCIVRPVRGEGSPLGIAGAEECALTQNEDKTFSADMTFRLVTTPIRVGPQAVAQFGFVCYLGPKSKIAFENIPEYSKYDYFQTIKIDFYCCAPAPIARLMMWLLQTLYWPTKNFGVAIILLVLIVRTLLHPITKAGQVNTMKMQKAMSKLQPKVDEIKKKYANDRQKMNEATMELYREAGVSPATQLLTCLPMALQIPIWAGLWAALASTVEMRHAPFDGYWIKDLAAPDALIPFAHEYTIPLLSAITGPIHAFNFLPILLTISMYLQQKYMPKGAPSPNQSSDEMAQQMKIMNFMTIFFGLMFYNAPSGLNLYIMVSNFGGLLEQWRIRKHIKKLEERDKNLPPGAAGGLQLKKPRFWAWLEKQAEEAKQSKPRKSKD